MSYLIRKNVVWGTDIKRINLPLSSRKCRVLGDWEEETPKGNPERRSEGGVPSVREYLIL